MEVLGPFSGTFGAKDDKTTDMIGRSKSNSERDANGAESFSH